MNKTIFSHYWIHFLEKHKSPMTQKVHFLAVLIFLTSWVPFLILIEFKYLLIGLSISCLLTTLAQLFIEKNKLSFKFLNQQILSSIKMFVFMTRGELKEEIRRVYGLENPGKNDRPKIDLADEEEYQLKMNLKINDDIVDHPFTEYWDVFVMKHHVRSVIIIHIVSILFYWVLFFYSVLNQVLWPFLFLSIIIISGNLSHKFLEPTHIEPLDAITSPRSYICIHIMMYYFLTGQYQRELDKRKKKLEVYVKNKSLDENPT